MVPLIFPIEREGGPPARKGPCQAGKGGHEPAANRFQKSFRLTRTPKQARKGLGLVVPDPDNVIIRGQGRLPLLSATEPRAPAGGRR